MEVLASYKTNIGSYRSKNQDSLLFLKNKSGQALAVICDGLGGHSCGEIASRMAVKLLKKYFVKTKWNTLTTDDLIYGWFNHTIMQIQETMNQFSAKYSKAKDMGTTMVATLIANNKVYLLNIGDSRIYLFNNKGLKQLTKDHNVLNMYLKEVTKPAYDIDLNKTYWKALTSALGPSKNLHIDISNISIKQPSYLLLTSDGVHDFIEEAEITNILDQKISLKNKVKLLIKKALHNVSTDNLSAVLVQVTDTQKKKSGGHSVKI